MSIIPSDHGVVVQNKESGQFYASLDHNVNPEGERLVRALRVGESVMSYGIKEAPDGWSPDAKHVSAEPDDLEDTSDNQSEPTPVDQPVEGK